MVGDWVLDDLDELLLGRSRADLVSVQQLDHETSKTFECSRDADGGAHADEDVLGCLDVYLELASLVDGRVEQSEQALVSDVGTGFTDVAPHLAHDSNVVVAVQQVVLVFTSAWSTTRVAM